MYAIVVSKPIRGDLSPASVSYTAGFYHIPVIGISSRDSAFSDKVTITNLLTEKMPFALISFRTLGKGKKKKKVGKGKIGRGKV